MLLNVILSGAIEVVLWLSERRGVGSEVGQGSCVDLISVEEYDHQRPKKLGRPKGMKEFGKGPADLCRCEVRGRVRVKVRVRVAVSKMVISEPQQ